MVHDKIPDRFFQYIQNCIRFRTVFIYEFSVLSKFSFQHFRIGGIGERRTPADDTVFVQAQKTGIHVKTENTLFLLWSPDGPIRWLSFPAEQPDKKEEHMKTVRNTQNRSVFPVLMVCPPFRCDAIIL